jgi:hypothetical protein
VLLAIGCSEELLAPATVVITTGQEQDVWSAAPEPVAVEVDKILTNGERVRLTSLEVPAERFSLGRGQVGVLDLTGRDSALAARVRGRSLRLDPAGLATQRLPLFVGRSERFSRPNGRLPRAAGSPRAALVGGRFLIVTGASDAKSVALDAYDLAVWEVLSSQADLACAESGCAVGSLAGADTNLLFAAGNDFGAFFDFETGATFEAKLPEGLSGFAEVAGGATVLSPDGSAYIVGPSRTGTPSDAVLKVGSGGSLDVLRTTTARSGAAATWVEGRGLVVVAGSDSGAGVELLADGSNAFVPLAYPPDPTAGAALIAAGTSAVQRLGGYVNGGYAPVVELSLGCGTDCAAVELAPPIAVTDARAFDLGSERVVVGTVADGTIAPFRLIEGGVEPLAVRESRRDAAILRLPTGHVAIIGGVGLDDAPLDSLELYLP